MTCRGNDPACTDGWLHVIEIHEAKGVVETRPYGPGVLADPERYTEAWAVFDGQRAYEALKPCRFCKPNWVPPEDRKDPEAEEDPKEGRHRKASMWDDAPVETVRALPE